MSATNNKLSALVSSEEKIARLLALLLIKDIESKLDQVRVLRTAGFQVSEVASLLGITEKHVTVASAQGRSKKKQPQGKAKS